MSESGEATDRATTANARRAAERGQAQRESGEAADPVAAAGGGRGRRSYVLALLASLAGAGLALYAITRTWSVHLTPRTGLSDLREARTGTDLEPWVTALAVVALAGTGALLATSGWVRRALGALLAVAGAGVIVGAIAGRAGLDPGAAGAAGTAWPIACAAGGVIILLGGLTALSQGHRWPRMSARYDRKPEPAASPAAADHRAAWDALDRGDDPTAG